MAKKGSSTKGKRSSTSVAKVSKIKTKVKGMFVEQDGVTYTFSGVIEDEGIVTTESYPVELYARDVLDGTICTNVITQRSDDQWGTELKSELIYAMLKGRPIGNILLTERNKHTRYYADNSVIDGLQRTSAIVGFINNEFRLSKSTPAVKCSYTDENGNTIETTYQLAGRKFEQLPEILQNKLLRYQLTVCVYKNFTDDAIDKIMLCTNSGKPLSPYNKLRFQLGSARVSAIQPICESTLWEDISVNLKNDSELACVLRIMMLLSYKTVGGFTVTAMKKFVAELDIENRNIVKITSDLVEQLAEIKFKMTDDEIILLDGCNIPHFIYALKKFNQMTNSGKNIHNKTFLDFFRAFLVSKQAKKFFKYKAPKDKSEKKEDKENGSGGTQYSAESIEERQEVIDDFLDDFLDAPLTENKKVSDINTNEEDVSYEGKEDVTECDSTGDTECADRKLETENVSVSDKNDTDMHRDRKDSGGSGRDRHEGEEKLSETSVLQADSLQIDVALPLNSGYCNLYECVSSE